MRRALIPTTLVLVALVAGCSATRGPSPEVVDARARLDRAQQLVDDADGGRTSSYSWVETPLGDLEGSCAVAVTEPSSVAPHRTQLTTGTPLHRSAPMCTSGASFLADGDRVYVADFDVEGRLSPMYHWATVAPDVLAEVRDTSASSDVTYGDALDHAETVREEPGEIWVSLDEDSVAGLLGGDPGDLVSASATFRLADDGMLTEARYELRDQDRTRVVLHRFEEMGVPQGLEVPAEEDLHPESPRLESPDAVAAFAGMR